MRDSSTRLLWQGLTSLTFCLLLAVCSSEETRKDGTDSSRVDPERQRVTAFWQAYRQATRHRMEGDFPAARLAYEDALTHNPRHEDALYYLGNVAVELGLWPLAEESWQKLVLLDAASSRAYAQLGNLYLCRPNLTLFDLSKSERSFRESIRLNREETGPLLRLAEVYLAAGRVDSAVVYLDAVLATNPTSAETVFMRAWVDWSRGDRYEALAEVRAFESQTTQRMPDRPMGEGDTGTGAGPMLAPGAGCPLFESFGERITAGEMSDAEILEQFRMLAQRLTTAQAS